ncbi:MAG TPA: AI-2E family transporter [Verrucomicrobiota bacterium]|nr:AI-2E family transporter [Verrucomicrobiota bacterium]HNT13419.1 AI-2E family transporter [Verrucomicrobiota bacterium]
MSLPPPTEKQTRIIWMAVTGLAIGIIVALVVALVWGLGEVLNVLSPVIWPIAVAAVLACLLDPVVGFLERRRVPRMRAVAVVFVLALLIVLGLAASVVPRLVVESQQLAQKSSEFTKQLPAQAAKLATNPPRWLPERGVELLESLGSLVKSMETNPPVVLPSAPPAGSATNETPASSPAGELPNTWNPVTDYVTRLLPRFGEWMRQVVGFVGTVFGVIAGLALVPIYAFYFLLEKQGINRQWRDYLPVQDSRFKDELVFVLNAISEYLVAFFRGQVLVAICDGMLYMIGFALIGLPYALLIGVMATFLTIIPFLGAITTCVSALVIAVVAFGDWQHPALVLLVFAVVQGLEGFVIQPKIMGDRVGLHPVTIIIALMVGTTLLGGILGGILAIPLAAVLRVVLTRYVWNKPAASR